MNKPRDIPLFFTVCILILASCIPPRAQPTLTQEELLQNLGIANPSKFAGLPPCEQIELFATVGSQFLDLDPATALVPPWMNEEIAKQPRKQIADCIADQGDVLLGQFKDYYTSENETIALGIHALIYKARDLNIVSSARITRFILDAICTKQVYYRESIAIMYWAATQPDLQYFPAPDEIIKKICGQ
jgi:hypothetical protein